MPELVLPDSRYQASFLDAMDEFVDEGRRGDRSMLGSDLERFGHTWASAEGFAAYLKATRDEARVPRGEGFVCSTTYWWVDGEKYVGRIAIRHELTDFLRELGGHIGYDIRRSRRREGHATAMLGAALPKVRELGIDPVLITCDTTNVGSRRVIEANGGVFEDERGDKLRFWVPARVG